MLLAPSVNSFFILARTITLAGIYWCGNLKECMYSRKGI